MAMMISKFHKIIQSKTIWLIFLGVIIIAFVFAYMPGLSNRQAMRQQRADQVAGLLFGEEVSNREFAHAYRNEWISLSLRYGQVPDDARARAFINEQAWTRIATLKKAEQLGFTVSLNELKTYVENHPIFKNKAGQFDPSIYISIQRGLLPQMGMAPEALDVYFKEAILMEKVTNIPAQGALVTEAEIKKYFHLYNDELTVAYGVLPRTLATTPEVTEEMAKAYYDTHAEEFRTPEKVDVNYVAFAVNDFMDQEPVADEKVAQFYENNKERYLKEVATDAEETAEPEYKALEEVKDEIIEEIKLANARSRAADQADELVSQLSDDGAVYKDVLAHMKLQEVSNVPPFGRYDSVEGVNPSTAAQFSRTAFDLQENETHYYSDPVVGKDTVYVIKLNQRIQPILPAFEAVKAEATELARMEAENKAYMEAATEAQAAIKEAVAGGTAFTNAVASYNVNAVVTEPFTASSNIEDPQGQLIKRATIFADKGTVSELIESSAGQMVAYISERVAADEMVQLPTMREEIVSQLQSMKASQLVSAWKQALLDEANFVDLKKKESKEENS